MRLGMANHGNGRDREKSIPHRFAIVSGGKKRECNAGGSLEKTGRGQPARWIVSPGCEPTRTDAFLPHIESDTEPVSCCLEERILARHLIEAIEEMPNARGPMAE